ncbi:MAG: YgiT-type zinc finger protein [Candidatus Kapaibacterium sp.]
MFTCRVCGSHRAEERLVQQTFEIEGQTVIVERIPARVCLQCGEIIFDIDTAEQIRSLLREGSRPDHIASIPVYELAG